MSAEELVRVYLGTDLDTGSPGHSCGPQVDSSIERLLLQLGKEQIRSRKANQRTELWATAFSNWEKAGI